MIIFIILLWFGIVVSFYLMIKEQRKKEAKYLFRIEDLERRVDELSCDDRANEKIRKISRMATELLHVLQEKEDDFQEMIASMNKNRERAASPVIPVETEYKGYSNSSNLSQSEQHTIEMLRKRRSG